MSLGDQAFYCPGWDQHGLKRHMLVMGHVWTAPTGQGIFGFLFAVGCKPCVRPVCAALIAAGPDVIRRSGPYQWLALKNA
jgi:hypothetical protein